MTDFSKDELQRYLRHFSLSEVGIDGQKKLKQAKVLLVGAGGLASPASLYLASAGVGHVGIIDNDTVELSNLQRQVLFSTNDVGKPKVAVVKDKLQHLNPHVSVTSYPEKLDEMNALAIIKQYDLVLDCSDNFPTRYIVNDACWHLNKPNVYASISQFEGQCTVFTNNNGPCYRCLYAEPPPSGLIPNCAEGGVLGALPGLLGTLQALQALTLILGIGEPLIGRLLMVDVLRFSFNTMQLSSDPACLLCAKQTAFTALPRPSFSCEILATVPEINVEEFLALENHEDVFVLDVREPYEYDADNIGGHLIPLGQLSDRLSEIDTQKTIIVHCESGKRSQKAVNLLKNKEIYAKNLQGGLTAIRQLDNKKP